MSLYLLMVTLLMAFGPSVSAQSQPPEGYAAFPIRPEAEVLQRLDQVREVVTESATNDENASGEVDDVQAIYNPAELVVSVQDLHEADSAYRHFSQDEIESQNQKVQDKSAYFVPTAPSKAELLAPLANMSREDVDVFVAKKQKFLESFVSGWMRWLHVPKSYHNRLLQKINDQLFASAQLMARSNRSGLSLRFHGAFGLGLQTKLAQKFAGTRIGKWLPSLQGFYLMTSLGANITRVVANGKSKWVVEFFGSGATLKSVESYVLASLNAGLTLGPIIENIDPENPVNSRELTSNHFGALGFLAQSDDHFSLMIDAPMIDISIPPAVNFLFFYHLKEYRRTLGRWTFGERSLGSELLCREALSNRLQ